MHKHNKGVNNIADPKGTNYLAQLSNTYQYLLTNTATATMVTEATGIPQKNITRFKRVLEKQGQLWQVIENRCKHTGRLAWYLTTDELKKPKPSQVQLKLF